VDWLALRQEVLTRIRSSGGRPTDRTWTIERQVPFRQETWNALQDIANEMHEGGASANPAQLAALYVEQGIKALGYPRTHTKQAPKPRVSRKT